MFLFTSLYFSDLSGSTVFFSSALLLLHGSRISAITQFFFPLMVFSKDLTVSVTAVLKPVESEVYERNKEAVCVRTFW